MKNILIFFVIILMASCAKMEFEDFTEPPSVSKEVFFDEVSAHSKENSWEVVYLYFLDKQTKKPKAKYRKALYGIIMSLTLLRSTRSCQMLPIHISCRAIMS